MFEEFSEEVKELHTHLTKGTITYEEFFNNVYRLAIKVRLSREYKAKIKDKNTPRGKIPTFS